MGSSTDATRPEPSTEPTDGSVASDSTEHELEDKTRGPVSQDETVAGPKRREKRPAPKGEPLPRRFGKYTLIRKLATGGMAELFLALQTSMAGFEKLIVVKRVLPHLAQDRTFIELLLTEARIAATLNHPNVAHIYDVGEVDGDVYIAMEHIHGEDIRSIVRRMRETGIAEFPLEHALAIVIGCCAGLAVAHEKTNLDGEAMNIVHRDVSPQNILVTFTGDVKLVDFGIAKAGRGPDETTGSGQLKGKIPYMSPEQAQGLPLDGRSDIFSLGILLFELVTGRRLFRGPSELETLRIIVETEYPRATDFVPDLDPALEAIIARSLEKDRDRRYASAREMQADLEKLVRERRLEVSTISLGAFMRGLFAESLIEEKKLLHEARMLADSLDREGSLSSISRSRSGVRERASAGRRGQLVGVTIGVLAVGAGIAAWGLRPGTVVAPPAEGSLVLDSVPPGAEVWVDGQLRPEHTPARITPLAAGSHRIIVRHEGYADFEETLLVRTDESTEVRATLERTQAELGVVRVETTPRGATVLVDGRDTGLVTPATVSELAVDESHRVAVVLEGWVSQSRVVTAHSESIESVSFALERTPLSLHEALLTLTLDPPDARVELDGVAVDGPRPLALRTTALHHRLRVSAPGHRAAEREFTLRGASNEAMTITLAATSGGGSVSRPPNTATATGPGTVRINADPWCDITFDGREWGSTPIGQREAAAGRHTVVCSNPELGVTRTVEVDVRAGETSRVAIRLQ